MMDNKLRDELKESYVIEPRDIAEYRGVELPKDLFKPTQAEIAAKTASMKNTQNMEGKKDEKKDPKDKKGRNVRNSGSTRQKSAKNSGKGDKNKTKQGDDFKTVDQDLVMDDQILDPNQLKDDVNLFEINEPKTLEEEELLEFDAMTKQVLTLFADKLPETELYKFGREKKEEKKAAPPVKGAKVVEEVVEEEYDEVTLEDIETIELPNRRKYQAIPIIYNHGAMNSNALKVLPAPDFPDPQS